LLTRTRRLKIHSRTAETDASELLRAIARTAQDRPNHPAYIDARSGDGLSYAELWQRVTEAADHLFVIAADRRPMILQCANVVDFAIWFLAALVVKVSVFPVSPAVPKLEVDRLVIESGAKTIVTTVRGRVDAESLTPRVLGTENSATHFAIALSPKDLAQFTRQTPSTGILLASSGTTSAPKIVHRSVESLDAVARDMVEAIGLTRHDRVLAAVPLTHSYGLEHGLLGPLTAGASVVLTDGMDLASLARLAGFDISILPAVPAMIEILCGTNSPVASMRTLRLIYSAGAPLPASVRDQFTQHCSLKIGQVYGMTEIGSVTFNDPRDANFDASCVGRPMRSVSILVVDPDSRAGAPEGAEGELLVHSPSMLCGYVGEPAPMEHGHFVTGDLGRVDLQGRVTITGRRRLLIDTGGLKVNPLEVEAVFQEHAGVAECLVLPMRQSCTVDRLRAIIVPRDPAAPPTEDSLRSFARGRLAAGKLPRIIELAPSLPRSASGKVLRAALEEP